MSGTRPFAPYTSRRRSGSEVTSTGVLNMPCNIHWWVIKGRPDDSDVKPDTRPLQ